MKAFKKTRRYVTLIEMMIVMFLISMIIGVIAYNYQGSLDEGKAFKTKAGIEKIKTILLLQLTENPDAINGLESNWTELVKKSPLVQNANSLIKDGWGNQYRVRPILVDDQEEIEVVSDKYNAYKNGKNSSMFGDEKTGKH